MIESQTQTTHDWDQYWDEFCDEMEQKFQPILSDFEYDPLERLGATHARVVSMPKQRRQPAPFVFAKALPHLLKWSVPAVVGGALVVGLLYPEKLGIRASTAQKTQVFALPPVVENQPEEPIALKVYSDRQQKLFQTGLPRFTDADLLQYASRAQHDLENASTLLAAHMADALTLTKIELASRGLDLPPIVRSAQPVQTFQAVQQVLIPLPE